MGIPSILINEDYLETLNNHVKYLTGNVIDISQNVGVKKCNLKDGYQVSIDKRVIELVNAVLEHPLKKSSIESAADEAYQLSKDYSEFDEYVNTVLVVRAINFANNKEYKQYEGNPVDERRQVCADYYNMNLNDSTEAEKFMDMCGNARKTVKHDLLLNNYGLKSIYDALYLSLILEKKIKPIKFDLDRGFNVANNLSLEREQRVRDFLNNNEDDIKKYSKMASDSLCNRLGIESEIERAYVALVKLRNISPLPEDLENDLK